MDQGKGVAKSGPRDSIGIDNVLWSFSSCEILAQTKIDIMQHAVAKCPKVGISCKGFQIPLLLDSDSKVSLICQTYFKEHLLPRIQIPTGEKADAHALFNLTMAKMDIYMKKIYIELDISFMGLKVPNVGFLILEEPNSVLDKTSYKTSRHYRLEFDMAPLPGFHGKIWGRNF